MSDPVTIREPEEPDDDQLDLADEPVRPETQAGAEDDPDIDQYAGF